MEKGLNRRHHVLLACSVVFFFLYNVINSSHIGIFNSPDATANFAFIFEFVMHSDLSIEHVSEYGALAEYIHPRSTFADFGTILPVGFWGLVVIFGVLGKLIGAANVVFITPLLAIGAAWGLFAAWRRIFSEKQAFCATLVYLLHPVVWYYSARSLLPNVPFFSLLIIGASILLVRPFSAHKQKWWYVDDILGSLVALSGLLIRPNEIVWIAPVVIFVLWMYRKHIPIKRVVVWGVASVAFLAVYIFGNAWLYSSAVGGYLVSNSLETSHWYNALLPFGFDIGNILKTGYTYFVHMYWWLVLPAGIGLLFLWTQFRKKAISFEQNVYTISFVILCVLLFAYYGSQIDISYALNTIGVAYSRYWLPIHVLSLPFIFYGLDQVWIHGKTKNHIFSEVFLVVVIFMSPPMVFKGIDGLSAITEQLSYMSEVKANALSYVDKEDVIVTDREDKFFWPDRAVMVRFGDPAIPQAIASFIEANRTVFYFTPTLTDEKEGGVQTYIADYGLMIESVQQYGSHTMYQFSKQ